jgi:putative DNA primase/helicase
MLEVESGIAPVVIAARGYWTATTKRALQDVGFTPVQRRVPALVLPIHGVDGQLRTHQSRPDAPRWGRDGHVVKYETPYYSHMALDVPPVVRPLLGNPQLPLLITEGIKKGDALASKGACAVAVLGVWNWRGRNADGGLTALADWEAIALNDRQVYVVFDSDVMTKPQVHAALARLKTFLEARQARVALLYLPSGPHAAKVGVDDYLMAGHGLDDLLALATPTLRPRPVLARSQAAAPLAETPTPLSDLSNAEALVHAHGPDLHYCYPWKAWLTWTGTHWQRDSAGEVMRRAKQTVKRLAARADQYDLDAEVKALLHHVKTSLATGRLKGMVELAASEPDMPVQPEAFDADPWLLNCTNGTLDLRTGQLGPHQRTDLLTKCLAIPYDPQATCPTWRTFLDRIMAGHPALVAFLQRAAGYALTGDTAEQCLFLLYGTGANGKSTFLETLLAVVGEYGKQAEFSTFVVRHQDLSVRNDLAALRGVRVVSAVEVTEGKRFAEALVKQLTGQDTLTARFLFQEFFQFKPQCKLFLACNHKPVIRGTDHAIWRRIRLVPFTVTIPEAEQDRQLAAKLRAELPGILTWAVQGCLAWQWDGLAPPPAVQQATAGYRHEMDVVGQFLEECCLVDTQVRTKAAALFQAYQSWCASNGDQPIRPRDFGLRLAERGFINHKGSKGSRWWLGLGLLTPDLDARGDDADAADNFCATQSNILKFQGDTDQTANGVAQGGAEIQKVSTYFSSRGTLPNSAPPAPPAPPTPPAPRVPGVTGAGPSSLPVPLAPAAGLAAALALDACPHGGAHQWDNRVTYRCCRRCGTRDGQTPAEILGQ